MRCCRNFVRLGRWDQYVQVACWILTTTPDPSLPAAMSLYQILFGRSPRTRWTASCGNRMEEWSVAAWTVSWRRTVEGVTEGRKVLDTLAMRKEASRRRHNEDIGRVSAAAGAQEGQLVVTKEASANV